MAMRSVNRPQPAFATLASPRASWSEESRTGRRLAGRCRKNEPLPATTSLIRRSPALLAETGLHQLRRAHGADRDHAPGTGRAPALDFGKALPARAQLLHGAARPRGAAVGHLY